MLLSADDTLTAVDEARLLHQQRQHGFFCIARATPPAEGCARGGWSERLLPTSSLEDAARAARHQADTYISQASFLSRRRAVANTKMLRCVYVDLDVYNLGLRADDATIGAITRCATEAGLPEPTYITNSGRGLYAKWVFTDPITSDLLPQWQTLQDVLVALYRSLGADAKVKDAARVLRLAQTINSKSGETVRIVRHSEKLYSFHELCAAAAKVDVPLALGTAHQQSRVLRRRQGVDLGDVPTDLQALTNYSLIREPILMRRGTVQTLNWSRFLDLRDLVIARGGLRRGERDITLFWMTSFLAFAGVITPANLWDEVRQLLLGFPVADDFDPLRDSSLSTLIKRIAAHDRGDKIAYKGGHYSPIYTPRNQLLIDMLEITPEEERSMRCIISGAEKQRRADQKVPGRAERRAERQEMQVVAASLHAQGHSVTSIAQQLGRDRGTVHRWLRPDPQAGKTVVERRGKRAWSESAPQASQGPRHEQCAQRPSERRPFSEAELAKRTKIRPDKVFLQPKAQWDEDAVRQWLRRRQEKLDRLKALAEQRETLDHEVKSVRTAQAALATQILLSGIRRKIGQRGGPISNSTSISVLSNAKTGPPDEPDNAVCDTPSPRREAALMSEVRNRLERLRASAAGAAAAPAAKSSPPPPQPPAAPTSARSSISRARRFAGSDEPPPLAEHSLAPPPSCADTPEPAEPVRKEGDASEAAAEWLDDTRPAGSRFSAQEWDAAQAGHPDCIVFEMHKPMEVALVALPRSRLDEVRQNFLHRCLVLDETIAAAHPFINEATARIEHASGDLGTFRYKVIRARNQEGPATTGFRDSVLRNFERSSAPENRPARPVPPQEGERPSRSQRYGAVPR